MKQAGVNSAMDRCNSCVGYGDRAACGKIKECRLRDSWYAKTLQSEISLLRRHEDEARADAEKYREQILNACGILIPLCSTGGNTLVELATKAMEEIERLRSLVGEPVREG